MRRLRAVVSISMCGRSAMRRLAVLPAALLLSAAAAWAQPAKDQETQRVAQLPRSEPSAVVNELPALIEEGRKLATKLETPAPEAQRKTRWLAVYEMTAKLARAVRVARTVSNEELGYAMEGGRLAGNLRRYLRDNRKDVDALSGLVADAEAGLARFRRGGVAGREAERVEAVRMRHESEAWADRWESQAVKLAQVNGDLRRQHASLQALYAERTRQLLAQNYGIIQANVAWKRTDK